MDHGKPLLVTGAIIPKDGKILVAKRHSTSRFEPDKWEFPGGKVDFAEHPEESLKRELIEEMGVEIETGPLYEIISHVYDNKGDIRHVVLLFYVSRIISGNPKRNDCQDFRWVSKEEISSLDFVEADVPLVSLLMNDSGIWDIDS